MTIFLLSTLRQVHIDLVSLSNHVVRKYGGLAVPFSVLFLIASASPVAAQVDMRDNEKVLTCDESLMLQDLVVSAALEKVSGESVLIVILRPGKTDSSEALTKRRLSMVAQYFDTRGNRLPNDRLVIAVGSEIEGPSRLEYYLSGSRILRLVFPKGKHLCIECCGKDSN